MGEELTARTISERRPIIFPAQSHVNQPLRRPHGLHHTPSPGLWQRSGRSAIGDIVQDAHVGVYAVASVLPLSLWS